MQSSQCISISTTTSTASVDTTSTFSLHPTCLPKVFILPFEPSDAKENQQQLPSHQLLCWRTELEFNERTWCCMGFSTTATDEYLQFFHLFMYSVYSVHDTHLLFKFSGSLNRLTAEVKGVKAAQDKVRQ